MAKKGNQAIGAALLTLGVGAGLMYFLDPESGENRRAVLRDKLAGLPNDASRVAGDLATRARGLADDLESQLQETAAIPPTNSPVG